MELDEWQQKVLDTKGDICLRSGRQVGKSTVIAQKAAEFALSNPKKNILVIASVERQAHLLFEKILSYMLINNKNAIRKGKDRPTKSKLSLKNGSTIYSLPTGLSGYGIRGYTIDLLIADEAAFIPEDVWTAVTPMLAVTKGSIILLSTPHGKEGFYYDRFQDPSYTSFHVSSEDCGRIPKEYLEQKRKEMTKLEYAQEFLGEFIDELRQFFPTALIKRVMTVKGFDSPLSYSGSNFLGVDVARMGSDESVLASLQRDRRRERLSMIDLEITEKTRLTDTTRLILSKDQKFSYRTIYIDDGGVGSGVFDPLLEHEQTRRKVVAINNAARSLEHGDEGRSKRILKEDLYNNLLNLMERNNISLFDTPEVYQSLKCIQYEYTDIGKIKIFGNYSHITEALVRAAWCMKDKSLNIWIA